ncbi:carbonic anhydrase 1-like [Liolophura sinensis]|uniref:carbonic anhydrase 1-like n=1 Tax=Liolophura sinensis TaxID=3198878 RepID=UPI003158646C
MKVFFLSLAVLMVQSAHKDLVHFNYDPNDENNGPGHWGASCGSKVRQSPVNIRRAEVQFGQSFSLEYNHDVHPVDGLLMNNGHSASFQLDDSSCVLKVTGTPGIGNQTFELSSFHFHFGPSNNVGSEHRMNGRAFPAEIHFVHVNTKYSSLGEALTHPDGLAVIGVFLRLGQRRNKELSKVINKMESIETKESKVPLSVAFAKLMPPLTKVYSYAGSLTTPPCSEVVQWFICKQRMVITESQLAQLRMLKSGDQSSDFMSKFGNFRPIQPNQGRQVMANFGTNQG